MSHVELMTSFKSMRIKLSRMMVGVLATASALHGGYEATDNCIAMLLSIGYSREREREKERASAYTLYLNTWSVCILSLSQSLFDILFFVRFKS